MVRVLPCTWISTSLGSTPGSTTWQWNFLLSLSMNDSTAGENSLAYVPSSCAEGHLNNRLNAWSKFLRKSAMSWKKVSRGIKFAIPISSVEFAGAGRTEGWAPWGETPLQPESLSYERAFALSREIRENRADTSIMNVCEYNVSHRQAS